jgi:hypothetical protein
MSQSNSDHLSGRENGMADDRHGVVGATVVEEASLVRRMLEESQRALCDRCLDPRRAIAGIVLFRPTSLEMLRRLARSNWALCSSCLSALKEKGSLQVGHIGNWRA